MEYEELPGEAGSLPTLIEAPSSPEVTEEDGEESTRENTANKTAGKDETAAPFTCDLVGEGDTGQGPEDSLASILGGLLNKEQMTILRSFPTRQQRADYLRNIFNEMNAVELNAESAEGPMCYEMSGTLKYCDECSPEIRMFLKERVRDLKGYLPTLLSCSTVIFDISRDPSQVEEARWALRAILCSLQYLEKKSLLCFQKIKDVRKFILISSTMTWENTEKMKNRKKPVNEENLPLRKPHELFKEHKQLEQEVLRAGLKYSDIFKTYVLASGVSYGYEEDRFNYLFDLAWRNEEELPLLGDGHNSLPIIHVEDLAMLVFYCMTRVENSPTYLLAVEKNQPTLLQITESVSRGLTTGNTRTYALNERFPDNVKLHEDTFAMLTSELIFEPNVHRLDLPWKYNKNMVSNMAAIIDEYIESRNLCPFKIIVCGPPSSGKTKLARRLADIYDIKYINIEQVVKEYVEKLEASALEMARMMELMKNEPDLGPEKSEDDEDTPYPAPEEEPKPEESREGESEGSNKINLDNELDVIKHSMAVNGGIPEDSICIRILKKRLEEMDVLNHGYILDGWPETAPQAHGMFGKIEPEELPSPEMTDEEEEAEVADDNVEDEVFGEDYKVEPPVQRNFNINPTYLIQLDGDCDDLLFRHLAAKEDLERAQPSSVHLAQRMENYRELEKMCCRAFDFFDNMCLDVKVLRYQVGSDPCPFLGRTLKDILDTMGPPTNTGFLRRYLEEYKMIRKVQECEKAKKMKKRANDVEKMDVEYFRAACQFMDKWVDFKDNDIKEKSECIALDDNMLPEAVVEVVVRALMLVKETSPDDCMEFLAEFFLREYEKEKGKSTINTSCHNALAFRRCIDTILQSCEPSCLPLLPLAVDVIMKYRRFAALKGGKLPPDSCLYPSAEKEDTEIKSAGKKPDKKQDDSARDFSEMSFSDKSVYEYSQPDKSSSVQNISKMNLDELIEILMITNPIWKDKIESDSNTEGKPLKLSDESLKMLLDQLRQLSCEIRYRLKRRGIMKFDDESPICSLKELPTPGKECSGEIKPPYASEHSLDTKGNLEYKRKHEDGSMSPQDEDSRRSPDHDTEESDSQLHDSLDKEPQDKGPQHKEFQDKGVQVKIPSKDPLKSTSQIQSKLDVDSQIKKKMSETRQPPIPEHKDEDSKPEPPIPDNMVRKSTIITGPDGQQFVCNYGYAQRQNQRQKRK